MLVLAGALSLSACGGDEDDSADTNTASSAARRGEPIVIRTRKLVALKERTEPIATGEVLEGSSLGDSPFCAGGTILDSHGSSNPTLWLIVETITCADGTVKLRLEPDPSPGLTQTGSWKVVSGTGTFARLRGSGEIEAVFDPDPTAAAHVTLTGTVTR
jgi:hypothetical protein